MFCIDNYGHDERELELPAGGLYEDIGEQYSFQAELRGIDHNHYLLWAEDTFELIANTVANADLESQDAAIK